MIYFIVGKAKAGKTTRAYRLAWELSRKGQTVCVLDGDTVREKMPTGYSDEESHEHIMRIAKFASIIEEQGVDVIIALVARKKEWRQEARSHFGESKLIYVKGGEMWEGTEYEEPDVDELGKGFDDSWLSWL